MQQPYYVLRIHRPGRPSETRTITAARQVLGRDGGDIVLHDPQASAMHAELDFQNGQLVVRDLGSSNGTLKDGRVLPQFALSDGQSFGIGQTVVELVQIVGGQPLRSGGTVLGQSAAAARAGQGPGPVAGPAPAAAPPTQPKKGSPAVAIAAAVVGLGVVGVGGLLGWRALSSDDGEAAEVAQAEPEPERTEPEPSDLPDLGTAEPEPEPVVEKDLGELYRKVGQATVVIRVPGSVGSGAIIDPRGVILTNNHVIDGGERDGLRIKAKVTLGVFSEETQAFEPDQQLDAWVLKVDVDRDLALLELADPPEDLPHIELSDTAPYPGQKVAAVGHAGAGMLWAIKGGEISATGALSGHAALQIEDAQGYQKDMLARMKAQMDKQGRVIQSTAKILPGDSGGPLVDSEGRLVGVNAFGRIDRATNQWLSFHVHLAEVQSFVKEIPEHPLDLVPDPWGLVGALPKLADVDLDGIDETLVANVLGDGSQSGFYLDLDENSLKKGASTPSWEDLVDPERRRFDPELVMLARGGERHYWYDTDGDDHLDVYMLDPGRGRVTEAYRLSKSGEATSESTLLVPDGLDGKLFEDDAVRERFARIGPVVFPGAVERDAGGLSVPDPLAEAGPELAASDRDADGTDDTYVEGTPFHTRILWDLDQDTDAKSAYAMRSQLLAGTAEVEAVAVVQRPLAWVWYDTDADGELDVLLESSQLRTEAVTAVWAFGKDGALSPSPAPERFMGQRLVQPGTFEAALAGRWMRAASAELGSEAVAQSEGLGRFPSVEVSATASVSMSSHPDFGNAVATVTELGHDLILVDLDGGAALAKLDPQQAAARVRDGSFEPEYALLRAGDHRWAFYDTDGRGGFDLVLFGRSSGAPAHAWEVDGSELRPTDAGSSIAQWERYRPKKLREAFEALAPRIFPGQATAD